MKKFFALLLIMILVSAAFGGCSSNTDTESSIRLKIKSEDINNTLSYNKIYNTANKKYLESVLGEEEATQHYSEVALPEEPAEIEKQLERDLNVCHICEKEGILVTKAVAKEKAEAEYNALKTDKNQEIYYKALQTVLNEHKILEDKFLELLCEQAYYKYNLLALKHEFKNNQYDKNIEKTLDEQFDEYLDNSLN